MLRDILRDDSADVAAAVGLIARADADIILLQGIDWDAEGRTARALGDRIARAGAEYPHLHAGPVNRGLPTGADRNGDGFDRGPDDAHGYGTFRGQAGMVILSRVPLAPRADLTGLPWADLPGALLSPADGQPEGLRLSTTAHWVVRAIPADAPPLDLLAFHATPPVFDDHRDLNGRRNHDEAALWRAYLDGGMGQAPPARRFVILGDANLDPEDGDGRPGALTALLADPRLIDPRPASPEGRARARADGGANVTQRGNPALDTADWRDGPGDPGNLRVDYLLPSSDLTVLDAGILWAPRDPDAPRHGLVWVDIALP